MSIWHSVYFCLRCSSGRCPSDLYKQRPVHASRIKSVEEPPTASPWIVQFVDIMERSHFSWARGSMPRSHAWAAMTVSSCRISY